MNARPASQTAAVLVVLALALLAWWAVGPDVAATATSSAPRPVWFVATAEPGMSSAPIAVPEPLQQGIGIVRVHSESFEDPAFPSITTSKWSLSDRCAIFPGRSDVIAWGRRTCDASAGNASLWSVGGGTVGKALACTADYPATVQDPRRTCTKIDTILSYRSFNMSNQACMRVTFDYKADMPEGALRLTIGEPDDQGNVAFIAPVTDFVANTAGQWQRGVIRNFPEAGHKSNVVLAFFYEDATGAGGYKGVMIDNIHVDAMSNDCNAMPFPSPTVPTLEPTETEEGETPTNTPFSITTKTPRTPTPTATPKRPPRIALPLVLRRVDIIWDAVPHKTAPPPTITPTPSRTPLATETPTETLPPSDTPRPTRTPKPTSTPTRTPRPTPTEIPTPDVQIVNIREPEVGSSMEVVTLTNVGGAPQLLDRWRLYNLSHSVDCNIPDGVTLAPGASYEIRTGDDAVTDATGFRCESRWPYIWDNHKDTAQLWNEWNRMVSCYAYDANGPYNCMPSTP